MASLLENYIWRNSQNASEKKQAVRKKIESEKSYLFSNVLGLKSIFSSFHSNNNNHDETKETNYQEIEIKKGMPIIYQRQLDQEICIPFNSVKGRQVFRDAIITNYMNTYFLLSPQFHTQSDPNYCGISTLVMTLNALGVDPHRMWKYPWRWYDEETVNSCTPLPKIRAQGIDFESMVCLGRMNGLDIEAMKLSSLLPLQEFRDDVKTSCSSNDTVILLNYSRGFFNQTGTGHFTTIGGYNEAEDLILIMDTARFKFPPHWVKVANMWLAMKEIETASDGFTENMPRGYMLVKKSTSNHFIIRLSSHHKLTLQDDKFMQIIHSWNEWMNNDVTNPTKVLQNAIEKLTTISEELREKEEFRNLFLFMNEFNSEKTHTYRLVKKELETLDVHKYVTALDNNSNEMSGVNKLMNFICNWLLYWPYVANENQNNSNILKSHTFMDRRNLDQSLCIQMKFICKLAKHIGHHKTYKREELYFDSNDV